MIPTGAYGDSWSVACASVQAALTDVAHTGTGAPALTCTDIRMIFLLSAQCPQHD